jgi:hypothetical protein
LDIGKANAPAGESAAWCGASFGASQMQSLAKFFDEMARALAEPDHSELGPVCIETESQVRLARELCDEFRHGREDAAFALNHSTGIVWG